MLRRGVGSAPVVVGMLLASFALAHAGEPRALLELFTSQGCSSCPPADRLLGELANDPSVVAISVPIDYWDYLGWKDTLAIPGHSSRQRAYARVRGDRQVYTPQIVVNGTTHVLGSDRNAIERAIAQTDRNTAIMSTHVLVSINGSDLNVKVGASKEHLSGEVWLCPLAKAIPIAISRGENSGHTIIYHNVVRRWLKLGDWNGSEAAWNVPLSDFMTGEVDAAAVMVQQGSREKPGMIIGAAFKSLGARTTEVKTPATDVK